MTDLVSFVPPAATSSGQTAADSATSLADNFDTFLTILTAQIQNQDPLEPMDSSKFTEQLVQFSGVEQQIRSNAQLEKLIETTRSSTGAALASYLGQEAEIDSAGAQFTDDPIKWRYGLPSDVAEATVTITNADGDVVYSESGEVTAGYHDFIWDGRLFNGETAEEGVYYIDVVAENANGDSVDPVHSLLATITGVDLSYGEPAITTAVGIFSYSDIYRLTQQ